MSVEVEKTVTVAQVEVGEDYRIEVSLTDPDTGATVMVPLLWSDAEQLQREIGSTIVSAEDMLAEDFPIVAEHDGLVHGFDVAPICRDCVEGKHGACIGSAYIERGPDVDEVECGCSRVGHKVLGGAA